jgi:hypothetical protein
MVGSRTALGKRNSNDSGDSNGNNINKNSKKNKKTHHKHQENQGTNDALKASSREDINRDESENSNNIRQHQNHVQVNIMSTATRSEASSSLTAEPITNLSNHIRNEGSSQKKIFQPGLERTASIAPTPKESYVEMRLGQGGMTSFENDKRAIERYVRETLFSMKKFVTKEIELEFTGKRIRVKTSLQLVSLLTAGFSMKGNNALQMSFAKHSTSHRRSGECSRKSLEMRFELGAPTVTLVLKRNTLVRYQDLLLSVVLTKTYGIAAAHSRFMKLR